MLNQLRKLLSVLALASMAVFVIAVPVLLVMGRLKEYSAWIIGPFCSFMMLSMAALGLNWLMKKLAEKRQREAEQQENPDA